MLGEINLNPFFSLFRKKKQKTRLPFVAKGSENLGGELTPEWASPHFFEISARGAKLVLEVSGSIRLDSLVVHYSPRSSVNYRNNKKEEEGLFFEHKKLSMPH